jgi:predicted anti-sigma-YlaC factor YlaD
MNGHLNSEMIDRHIGGERSVEAENHLRECAACREAVRHMETALARFGGSTRAWSERQALARPPARWMPAPSRPLWIAPARWAAVAAAAIVLTALPVYHGYTRRQAAAQAKADAVLLDQIAADISRPAPEPLEPLIELISESSPSTTGETQ